MFQPPAKTIDPESLILANELLAASNIQLNNLIKFRSEQFQRFWYKAPNVLRSREEINAILEQMDAAQPGQSAQFFGVAKALVDLIDALSPGALQPEDWMPKYEYTIDPVTFSIRMDPLPEPEPTPEPEEGDDQ